MEDRVYNRWPVLQSEEGWWSVIKDPKEGSEKEGRVTRPCIMKYIEKFKKMYT